MGHRRAEGVGRPRLEGVEDDEDEAQHRDGPLDVGAVEQRGARRQVGEAADQQARGDQPDPELEALPPAVRAAAAAAAAAAGARRLRNEEHALRRAAAAAEAVCSHACPPPPL